MKHIVLDDSLTYDSKFRNLYFNLGSMGRTPYIKVAESVEISPEGLIKENSFRVVKPKNGKGRLMIVPSDEKSTRSLVFLNCVGNPYETVEINEELTQIEILSSYMTNDSEGNSEIKLIVLAHPSKPLVIDYINKFDGSVLKKELMIYDYLEKDFKRRVMNHKEFTKVYEQAWSMQRSYEECPTIPKLTREYLDNLTESDIKKLKSYNDRFGYYERS